MAAIESGKITNAKSCKPVMGLSPHMLGEIKCPRGNQEAADRGDEVGNYL
jgi:hypothetical protein